jgi:hypothetical protein
VIKSTEGDGTTAHEQILREAGKSLRELRKDERIIRQKQRAGQAISEQEDGPFMTDVAFGKHAQQKS